MTPTEALALPTAAQRREALRALDPNRTVGARMPRREVDFLLAYLRDGGTPVAGEIDPRPLGSRPFPMG